MRNKYKADNLPPVKPEIAAPAPSTGTDLNEEPDFTPDEQRELLILMANALIVAHDIVEGAIEGRALSANRLENYYGTWMELLRISGHDGCLISEDVLDNIEQRWPIPSSASEQPTAEPNPQEAK